MLFPIPLVLKLQMSAANKFAVVVIFALGGLGVCVYLYRDKLVADFAIVPFPRPLLEW